VYVSTASMKVDSQAKYEWERYLTISNGLGGQSMYLCYLASEGKIPANVSITADTGSELDCLWNTGERTTSREYFDEVVKPLCDKWGIDARFVRANTGDKTPMQSVIDYHGERAGNGMLMPLYGSRGGRLKQNCTERWKLAAIKQEARRMGATHLSSAIGNYHAEAARRVKGQFISKIGDYNHYQTAYQVKKTGKWRVVKWMTHYYPLVDMRMDRNQVRTELERLNIPYLISSECDCCPHKDPARWLRMSDDSIERVANLESRFEGEYFFTDRIKPLREVIAEYKRELLESPTLFDMDKATFDCDAPVCDI